MNLPYDQLIVEYYTQESLTLDGYIVAIPFQPRKQFLLFLKNGKTKYKPIIGKAVDLV